MVFFTCSNCNESLKKNKVDLHCSTKCRQAQYMSCVDCGTDFYGDDYKSHTSCVSEAQKYGGENYKESPNANKGQKKQEQWLQKVQRVLQTTTFDDPRLQSILESISAYPNLPQKKAKFLNFIKSTFPRYKHDQELMVRVWSVLEEAKTEDTSTGESKQTEQLSSAASSEPARNGSVNGEHGGSKKKKQKGEKVENGEAEVTNDKKEKKKKKKKRRGDEEEEEVLDDAEVAEMREKKWRKRDPEMEDVERLNDTLQEVEKQPRDFNLGRLITEVLDRKGTISLKNLRKKALSEFYECGISSMTEDKVLSKLDKKLRSMNNVKVVNEKVSYADEED